MALLKTHARPSAPAASVRTPEALLVLLRGGETEAERRGAALELAAEPTQAASLVACLRTETAPSVREAIVTALVGMGTAEAAAGLAAQLGGEDVALRNDAIQGLREIGAAAFSQVEHLLASGDPDVRIFAVNVLETTRHPHAAEWLRHILAQEQEVNVGLAAVEAMAQIGGPEHVQALRDFAGRFAEEPCVAFAVDAACRHVTAGAGR